MPAIAVPCGTAARHCRQGRIVGTHLLFGARSPSGAPRRRLPRRANARTQPRPRFTRAGGCRRYPHHRSRLSEAPRTPVVMPEGTIPGPPGSGLQALPAGTALAPRSGVSRDHVPLASEMGRGYCHRGGKVKGFRFVPMNQEVSSRAFFPQQRAVSLILWRCPKFHSPRGGAGKAVARMSAAICGISRIRRRCAAGPPAIGRSRIRQPRLGIVVANGAK
jgi:hypothetical protein